MPLTFRVSRLIVTFNNPLKVPPDEFVIFFAKPMNRNYYHQLFYSCILLSEENIPSASEIDFGLSVLVSVMSIATISKSGRSIIYITPLSPNPSIRFSCFLKEKPCLEKCVENNSENSPDGAVSLFGFNSII